MPTEADTCRKFVLPKLYSAGWNDEQLSEQRTFTDGRIMVAGKKVWRRPQKRADYLLRYYSLPVRDAWINAAIDSQPSSDVIWAEMGVWGPNWTLPNYDDFFWGMGNVGPDTRGGDIWGYWRIAGGS